MTTLRDLVSPVSPSVEAVLIGYGSREAFEAKVLSRKGENKGHSVYLIGLEVQLTKGQEKLLLEVPELRDPSNSQEHRFNQIQAFRNVRHGTNIAVVCVKDHLSTGVGYAGSILALVPLPASENTVAYSAELNLNNYLRAMMRPKDLQSLDC